jgi:hypothetical protein
MLVRPRYINPLLVWAVRKDKSFFLSRRADIALWRPLIVVPAFNQELFVTAEGAEDAGDC